MEAEKTVAEEAMPLFGELETETPAAVDTTPAETATADEIAAEPIRPAVETAASGPRTASVLLSEPTAHYGDYLRTMRKHRQLTLADLENATHIRAMYLQAIENEDYNNLPPAVYVLGYIKNLCRFYGLDAETVEVLTGEIRQRVEYESPSDSSKVIRDFEPSLENPRLLKRIVLAGCGILLLVALLTLLLIWIFAGKNTGAAGAAPMNETRLLELQPPPVLEDSVLPIGRGGR